MNYVKEKIGHKRRVRDKRKPDTRTARDPYYHMAKNETETLNVATDS